MPPFFPKRNRKAAFPVKFPMITSFSSLLLPPWAEERVTDIQFYFIVLIDIFYYGHTFGVRVDGTSSRRFLRFLSLTGLWPEGCGIARRAMSFISRLRRSRQHRVSILSAYLVHPFPLRGTSPQGETRDMRKKQRVIYFRYHFGVFPLWWLAPAPFPRKRGHYKAPLCCELLMKGPLFRALFCPLHRGEVRQSRIGGWRTQ